MLASEWHYFRTLMFLSSWVLWVWCSAVIRYVVQIWYCISRIFMCAYSGVVRVWLVLVK